MKTEEKSKTKILVYIYEPLLELMQHRFEAACLKRDAYLDIALKYGCDYLFNEAFVNSPETKRFISDNLKKLPLKQVNLLLSTETVKFMDDLCKRKNIPRDSFINRFVLLLTAPDEVTDKLFPIQASECDDSFSNLIWCYMGEVDDNGDTNTPNEGNFIYRSSILEGFAGLITRCSPFFYLKHGFEICKNHGEGNFSLFRYPFPKNALADLPEEYDRLKTDNIIGFNVFMNHSDVVASEEYKELYESGKKSSYPSSITDIKSKDRKKPNRASIEKGTPEKANSTGESL